MVPILAKNNCPVFQHQPYSLDLFLSDFFLFLKIKLAQKRTRFKTVESVKKIKQERLLKCFLKLLLTWL